MADNKSLIIFKGKCAHIFGQGNCAHCVDESGDIDELKEYVKILI